MRMWWNAPKWSGPSRWVTVNTLAAGSGHISNASVTDAGGRNWLIPWSQLSETDPATERECLKMDMARERDDDAKADAAAERNLGEHQ